MPVHRTSPDHFSDLLTCHLSGQIFVDPVIAPDGWTYERDALEQRIRARGSTSPITGRPMHGLPVPNETIRRICAERQNAEAAPLHHPRDQWISDLHCVISHDLMARPVRLSDGHTYDLSVVNDVMALPFGSPWTRQPFAPGGSARLDRSLQALCRRAGAQEQDYPAFFQDVRHPLLWPMVDSPAADEATRIRVNSYLRARLSASAGSYIPLRHEDSAAFWALADHLAQVSLAAKAEALIAAMSRLAEVENARGGLAFLMAGPWSDRSHFDAYREADRAYGDMKLRAVCSVSGRIAEARIKQANARFDAERFTFLASRLEAHVTHLSTLRSVANACAAYGLLTLVQPRRAYEDGPHPWGVHGVLVEHLAAVTCLVTTQVVSRGLDILLCPMPAPFGEGDGSRPWWRGLQLSRSGLGTIMPRAKSALFHALAARGVQVGISTMLTGHATGSWIVALIGAVLGAEHGGPPQFFIQLPPEIDRAIDRVNQINEALLAGLAAEGPAL